jgi:hypothetical protein
LWALNNSSIFSNTFSKVRGVQPLAQKLFYEAQTAAFRIIKINGTLTIFPQFLTKNGPNHGKRLNYVPDTSLVPVRFLASQNLSL